MMWVGLFAAFALIALILAWGKHDREQRGRIKAGEIAPGDAVGFPSVLRGELQKIWQRSAG